MWLTGDEPFDEMVGTWRVRSVNTGLAGFAWPQYRLVVSDASGRLLGEAEVKRLRPRLWRRRDGGINLVLAHGSQSLTLRLSPDTGSILPAGAGPQPIATLASCIDALTASMAEYERWEAPDGSLRIETEFTQWHMGSSSNAPRITDLRTGEVVLDLIGSRWDGYPVPEPDGRVSMRIDHLDRAGTLSIVIDPLTGTYRTIGSEGGETSEMPLAQLEGALFAAVISGERPATVLNAALPPGIVEQPPSARAEASPGERSDNDARRDRPRRIRTILKWIILTPLLLLAALLLLGILSLLAK